jgi:hypothetical protein
MLRTERRQKVEPLNDPMIYPDAGSSLQHKDGELTAAPFTAYYLTRKYYKIPSAGRK